MITCPVCGSNVGTEVVAGELRVKAHKKRFGIGSCNASNTPAYPSTPPTPPPVTP